MDTRTRWIGVAAGVLLLAGIGALAAQPLMGMRADIAAMRDLIEVQRDLLEQQHAGTRELIDQQETVITLADEQGDLTEEMLVVAGDQLDTTQAMHGEVVEQGELVQTTVALQRELLATSRELLEETRQTRRCACAVAEATDPAPTADDDGTITAAGTGRAAEITTANGCRAE